MERTGAKFGSALAVGGGAALLFACWCSWCLYRKRAKERPPSKWRKVGELSDLLAYPVKSLGAVRQRSMTCARLGLESGWLRDRTLLVHDLHGNFITARRIPRMVQISPSVEGSVLTLSAPNTSPVRVDLRLLDKKEVPTTIWGDTVTAWDCGDGVASWLSRFLLGENGGLRLAYYPLQESSRSVRKTNRPFPFLLSADSGAYPDATSYMLINEASIADLNERIDEPVAPLQFRPNFVVKGAKPLEEDQWDWIKIGSVVFRNVKPCTRCVFTTIDPKSGERHPELEPLRTLRKYRLIEDPALLPFTGDSPVMGIHLGLGGSSGSVCLGDPVYVGAS